MPTALLTDEQIDRLLAFQAEPQEDQLSGTEDIPTSYQENDFQPRVDSLTLRQIRNLLGSLREEGWNTPSVRSLRRSDAISWLQEQASLSNESLELIQSLI